MSYLKDSRTMRIGQVLVPQLVTLLVIVMLIGVAGAQTLAERAEKTELGVGEEKKLGGQLRAVDVPTADKVYEVKVGAGKRIEVEASVWHVEYVGSRVTVSIMGKDGGTLVGASDVVAQGGRKDFLLSFALAKETAYDVVYVVVSTAADRFAPSVLNFSLTVRLLDEGDAKSVRYFPPGSNSPQELALTGGDLPRSVGDALAMAEQLPKLIPGSRFETFGYLSYEVRDQSGGRIRVFRGNDVDDYYAFRAEVSPTSSISVTVRPQARAVLMVALMHENGFVIKSTSSPNAGEPATLKVNFTEHLSTRMLVSVSVLSSQVASIPYSLEIGMSEPLKVEKVTEIEGPLLPDATARNVVMGVAIAVIAMGIASVVVGVRRSRSSRGFGL